MTKKFNHWIGAPLRNCGDDSDLRWRQRWRRAKAVAMATGESGGDSDG
jgi:hypothetical protein